MNLFGIKFGKRSNSVGDVPRGTGKGPGFNNEILPPFGTKYPNMLNSSSVAGADLSERLIGSNPFDGFYLTLPAKLTPQQIVNILRSAQGGDVWQLSQLHDLALTMWPMYKKCCAELKEAASSVKFDIHPYCEEGEEPTDTAKEKADFVRRCLFNMYPDPANDERDFRGTLYHLADVLLMGVGMQEIIWNEPQRGAMGWERTPRATVFVHPLHFTYTSDGFLTVFDENYSRYQFSSDKAGMVYAPDPDRFICAQYYSHFGSPLSSGLIRPLGRWLSVYIFNQEWMFNFAQKYGGPFLDMTYAPGTPDSEIIRMKQFLANAASQGYVMHLQGTTIVSHPPHQQGSDNPQRHLAEEADKQCQVLILGQTLTTDMPASGAGSYAASQTHAGVKQEKIESLSLWMAHNPIKQLVRAILRVNYDNEDECPEVRPDFTPTLNAAEKGALISALGNCAIPFLADEIYKLLGFSCPEEGDKVLITGRLGECGPTDDELSAIGLQGVEEIDQQLELQEQQAKIAKKYAPAKANGNKPVKSSELRRILSEASQEDLDELRGLVVKAQEAPYANGELTAVAVKIKTIQQKARY